MPITFGGLATGLDTDRIILDLVRFNQRRIDELKSREQVATSKQKIFQSVESRLLTLQTQSAKLARAQGSPFDRRTIASSDESLVKAAASSSASAGVQTIRVLSLARPHQIASQGFDAPTSQITQGTFQIQVGTGVSTSLTIDSTNNTLQGLSQAINSAGVGVTATIISDGSDSRTQPYRLLLSSNNSGASNAITITNNLAADGGGAIKPNLNATHVGAAVLGTSSTGTSSVTSNSGAAAYTGTTNDAFTFTVVNGGVVGTNSGLQISFSDAGGSRTGTITLAQTDNDVFKAVADGVQVKFGTGTLVAGEKFTIDVFVPTVQSATNAQVQLGSGAGAVVVQGTTNQLSGLIPGVTLDLQSANASKDVQLTVTNDVSAVRQDILDFVADYNDFIDYIAAQTKFDPTTGKAAPLAGNRAVADLRSLVQRSITSVSPTLPQTINRLGVLGLTSDIQAKLVVNEPKLDDVLNGRVTGIALADVKRLFALDGQSTSSAIKFAAGSRLTKDSATPYQVDITQASRRATITATNNLATSTVIEGASNTLVVRIDETTSSSITLTSGTYSQLDLARHVETQINAAMAAAGRRVTLSVANSKLVLTSERHGSASETTIVSGSALSKLGFSGTETDRGLNVAGAFIVGGVTEAATGVGQVLTGQATNANTADLAVVATLTSSQVVAGAEANLTVTRGVASRLDLVLQQLLDPVTGRLKTVNDRLARNIDEAHSETQDEIRALDERKAALLRQFAALESTVNRLKSQGQTLTNTLGSLLSTRQ
ncbi:MAG: flagellar filament capping protein FliD [Planctomycetales bacterium]|nr:flagellar filament capping protein FliD [Planctomycetales bacterium]